MKETIVINEYSNGKIIIEFKDTELKQRAIDAVQNMFNIEPPITKDTSSVVIENVENVNAIGEQLSRKLNDNIIVVEDADIAKDQCTVLSYNEYMRDNVIKAAESKEKRVIRTFFEDNMYGVTISGILKDEYSDLSKAIEELSK